MNSVCAPSQSTMAARSPIGVLYWSTVAKVVQTIQWSMAGLARLPDRS